MFHAFLRPLRFNTGMYGRPPPFRDHFESEIRLENAETTH